MKRFGGNSQQCWGNLLLTLCPTNSCRACSISSGAPRKASWMSAQVCEEVIIGQQQKPSLATTTATIYETRIAMIEFQSRFFSVDKKGWRAWQQKIHILYPVYGRILLISITVSYFLQILVSVATEKPLQKQKWCDEPLPNSLAATLELKLLRPYGTFCCYFC